MIKIYTTPTCVFCEMAKEFLKEKKIAYKEYDVSRDEKAQKEMLEKTHQYNVPVFDIDGKIIIDFDRIKLEEAIQKQKSKSVSPPACAGRASRKQTKTKSKIKTKAKNYGVRSNNRRRGTGRSSRRHLRRQKKA